MLRRSLAVAAALLGATTAHAQVTRSASGANAAAIQGAVDQFRADLGGGTVPAANGSFGGLRREINWDGVPDASAASTNLPPNFFNSTSPRGAVFSTPGTGVQVSANAAVGAVEFGNIDPSYPTTFAAFSAQRLFTAIGSNVVDVTFFLPGTTTAGPVRGFGSVFSDVDVANTTSIQFFDASNVSLGTFFAPSFVGSETLSFLGVSFATPVVSRVRITSGNTALGPGVTDNNGARDLVVMDDFIYGEPVAATATVPEPGTWLLLATGLAGVTVVTRSRASRRRR